MTLNKDKVKELNFRKIFLGIGIIFCCMSLSLLLLDLTNLLK